MTTKKPKRPVAAARKPKRKAAAPDRDLMGQFAKEDAPPGAAARTRSDGVLDLVDGGEPPAGPASGNIIDEDPTKTSVDRDAQAHIKVSQKRRGADQPAPSARIKPVVLPAPDPDKKPVNWSELITGCNKQLREIDSLWAAGDSEAEQIGRLIDQVLEEAGFNASPQAALLVASLLYAVPRIILVVKSRPGKKAAPKPTEAGVTVGEAHPSDWSKLK